MTRRMVILAEGKFSLLESKTANQAIRYLPEQVVGVIDSRQAGRTAQQVLGFGGEIPVFMDLRTALHEKPNTLLVGIAPVGGKLPEAWRGVIKEAIESGLTIISGLHTLLREDAEFVQLASRHGVDLIDLRYVPKEYEVIAKGHWKTRTAKTVLTVGTDCNAGKMTASLELHREFLRRGMKSDFLATGQTGILLAGRGVAVDHLISDFVAGAIECEIEKSVVAGSEYLFVEGQGALTHQGYSAVALGLLHGVMPDAMILVHHPVRGTDDYGFPLHDIPMFIRLHETMVRVFKQTQVVGIAVNSVRMTPQQTTSAIQELERQTGLPAADVLTPDVTKLAEALERYLGVKQFMKA